ncbi:hypothetical protein CHS0354_033930 [Potamilus streckersoni]|uniref:Transmembrane protein 70 n=1 Tax=Potamilus streckersoni TaxID=2493646 RepID=A0AAE0RWX2_9BIVA|nr:hypothetical protein CHS0354_033930 [Potamilus streckersoni]
MRSYYTLLRQPLNGFAKLCAVKTQTSVRNIVKRNPLSCMGYMYTGQVHQCHYLHYYKNFLVATSLPKYNHIPFHQYSTPSQPQEVDQLTKLPLYDTVKGDLVYTGELSRMIKLLKGFSLSTSVLGLCLQPYLVTSMGAGVLAYAMVAGMSFFIFLNPALIHWLTRRYVTDMYFNQYSKKFVAATISFFLRRREIEFFADDVMVPDITGPFTSVTIKNKPYFFVSNSFKSKDAYVHMMGYDKPMDGWELPNKNDKKRG